MADLTRLGGLDPPSVQHVPRWRTWPALADLTRLWCSKCHDGGLDPPWRTWPASGAAQCVRVASDDRFSGEGGMQIGLSTLGRSDWGPGTVCRSLD